LLPAILSAHPQGSLFAECRGNPNEEKRAMKNMKRLFNCLMVEESGQDLIEYALVAALVGLGAVAAMKGLSNSIGNTFNGVGNSLTNAVA
jgi:pilus assembly protein Flp/PilA